MASFIVKNYKSAKSACTLNLHSALSNRKMSVQVCIFLIGMHSALFSFDPVSKTSVRGQKIVTKTLQRLAEYNDKKLKRPLHRYTRYTICYLIFISAYM